MIVSSDYSAKIDLALKNALENADGHERLRAVMVVGDSANDLPSTTSPYQGLSRSAARQQMIDNKKNALSQQIGFIKDKLNDLSLTVRGGSTSRVIVVEGTAQTILTSLNMSEIKHASLDLPL